jgi:hypothetical protein
MQKLTLKRVKTKALEAYHARTLAAQHRRPELRVCAYKLGSCKCAIGAGLTNLSLKAIDTHDRDTGNSLNWMSVDALVQKGIVEIDPTEQDEITEIQSTHDQWAKQSRLHGANSAVAKHTRKAFLAAIAA